MSYPPDYDQRLGASIQGLERTSDRLLLRVGDPTVVPADIPEDAIQRLARFRKEGILPLDQIIINTHAELALDVHPQTDFSLEQLVDALHPLKLSTGGSIMWEPELETIDFYVVDGKRHYTQRLRFYIQHGQFLSSRIILADTSSRPAIKWIFDNFSVPARSEHVYVVREDAKEGASRSEKFLLITQNMKEFFRPGLDIRALVYKRVRRGNFGNDWMWDHREARFLDSDGVMHDATNELGVIGMGPYIAFSAQKIRKFEWDDDQQLPVPKAARAAQNIVDGTAAESVYHSFIQGEDPVVHRIELECKGEKGNREGAYLVHQLIGKDQLLDTNNIQVSISPDRKIKA